MSTSSTGVLSGLAALVIDDAADTRELLTVVLTAAGAEVVAVQSAGTALEVFNRRRFDVLLSDAGLPERDGWNLIETIRRMTRANGGRIPAIAVTARAYPADIEHSLASGFNALLSKPVEMDVVVATIARLVGRPVCSGMRGDPTTATPNGDTPDET